MTATTTNTAAADTTSLQLLLTSSTTTYNINFFNLKMILNVMASPSTSLGFNDTQSSTEQDITTQWQHLQWKPEWAKN